MRQPPEGMEIDADEIMENPRVMIAPADHPLLEQASEFIRLPE